MTDRPAAPAEAESTQEGEAMTGLAPEGPAPLMTHVEDRVAAITRRLRQLALSKEITVSAMSMLVGDANYLDDLAASYVANTRPSAPPSEGSWE